MKQSQGFPPVSNSSAQVLILGSMPGIASLEATEYYAFPRNAFWKIMADLFDLNIGLDYRSRLQGLMSRQIALWDVIASCCRPGSLDSAISGEGMVTNDFGRFFNQHPQINNVYFNGQKAASLFRKKVKPGLHRALSYHALPSTSPANASMSYAAKLEAWSVIKDGLGDPDQ